MSQQEQLDLVTRTLRKVRGVAGPLLFVDGADRAHLGEMVRIRSEGVERRGEVIEIHRGRAVVQVFEETRGLAPGRSEVMLTGEVATLGVGEGLLGRSFNGAGEPVDGMPPPIPSARRSIAGAAMNVDRRAKPSEFIETGISAIDGMNTLVRGQKLPIFSGAGLPAHVLAAQIVRDSRVPGGDPFCVVFAAVGIPFREADYYRRALAESAHAERTVAFLNLASDPTIERLMTPRCALTAAEYLAFDLGMHVLVVITDMTHYCEALREVAVAREEIPGRRGYPGYMYTDLASIFERAGKLKDRPGSVTQLPILTMPDDDITHPIPDLTGYITEGQVVLSRDLDRKRIFPPIDVLPSLSRLMGAGVGKGRTRPDHRAVADQLYAFYARGVDVRRMEAIVGETGLGDEERALLRLADRFENEMVNQGSQRRTLDETLEIGWKLFADFPEAALTRVPRSLIEARRLIGGEHAERREHANGTAGRQGQAPDREPGNEDAPKQAGGTGQRAVQADADGNQRPPAVR